MTQAILIAAIAALAPTLTALATFRASRQRLERVEQQTNGHLDRLNKEVEMLKHEVITAEIKAQTALNLPPPIQ